MGRAYLAALTTLSSALSPVFKAIPRSLVVETVGMVWVQEGVSDEMGGVTIGWG